MATKKTYTVDEREAFKEKSRSEVKDLLERLSSGVKALVSSDDWRAFLAAQVSLHRYSFGNIGLILSQCPNATSVAGYGAWAKLGRHVRKGEKAIKILAPVVRKVTREVEDDLGNLTSEERRYMLFRAVSVFDVSQTDGPALGNPRDLCTLLSGQDEAATEVLNLLTEYAERVLSFKVTFKELEAPLNGWCSGLDKELVIASNREPLQKAKTLAHEIGHAILHSSENRDVVHTRRHMEVEAESVAFCLMAAFGLDSSDYSFGYVAGWSGGDVKKVEESGRRIQKAVHQVLEYLGDRAEIAALKAENATLRAAA